MTHLDTTLLDAISLPYMILDRDLRFTYANSAYLASVKRTREELIGEYVFDAFPETDERVANVKAHFDKTLMGESTSLDAQPFILEHPDGTEETRIWQAVQDPVRNAQGEVTHIVQYAEDITSRVDLESRNQAMTIEINHRVKNLMAVVTAIARISSRTAKDLPSFMTSFTNRIASMAAAHDRLAHDEWRGLTVRQTLTLELEPFAERTGANISYTGPKVKLSIAGTKDLAMVVHELLTNAIKYGCFTSQGGSLDVAWQKTEAGLNIDWIETSHCAVSEPGGKGFGSRLFDMLPHVSVTRDFTPTGLHLSIAIENGEAFA